MLTKETKQQAEKIRDDVAELLANASQLLKKYGKAGKEYADASKHWKAWQHFQSYEARTNTPEESQKAAQTYQARPKEWAATVDELEARKEAAAVSSFVARVNVNNFLNYAAQCVAELVRPFWRSFALRKGAEDLGELLTPPKYKDVHAWESLKIYVNISGGNVGAVLFPSSFIRLDVHITNGQGVSGHVEGVKMGEDVPDDPRRINAPKVLTVAQYEKITERLEAINNEARHTLNKLTGEARALVRGSGLYGFAEFLAGYSLTVSK